MNRIQNIQCFLTRYRESYNSLENWLDKQILFACSTGFCGVYYKLGILLNEQQLFTLAARVMGYYLNSLYQHCYIQRLDIAAINLNIFQDMIPEEFWSDDALGKLQFGGISDLQLDFLIEWSLEEVVLEQIFSSLATFQTTLANPKPILC